MLYRELFYDLLTIFALNISFPSYWYVFILLHAVEKSIESVFGTTSFFCTFIYLYVYLYIHVYIYIYRCEIQRHSSPDHPYFHVLRHNRGLYLAHLRHYGKDTHFKRKLLRMVWHQFRCILCHCHIAYTSKIKVGKLRADNI